MSIDLDSYSARELSALISQASKRKSTLDKRKSAVGVRRKLTALAKAEGYTIAELFGDVAAAGTSTGRAARASGTTKAKGAKAARGTSAAKGRKLGKVAPKYRNPDNAKETWSGRGKQPRWLAARTGAGASVTDFLIAD